MIKQIYWQFLDEVDGVSEYVDSAAKCKEKNREMASMYIDMAKTEVSHAEKLLDAMKKIAHNMDDESEHAATERGAADILVDVMNGQLVKARAMMMAFE